MGRLGLHVTAALGLALLAGAARGRDIEVNVMVDLTADGAKAAPASPDKPAYYLLYLVGYQEFGALMAGEGRPPQAEVERVLRGALAKQGYLPATSRRKPSLLLVFCWGYMNPQIDTVGNPAVDGQQLFYNQNQMLNLVAGHAVDSLNDFDNRDADTIRAAGENRYFLVVWAYDYAAALKRQKKLLWTAKMSSPSAGVALDEALPVLIANGTPLFGRAMDRPVLVSAPVPKGRVEVGTPQVKEYLPPSPQPAPPPSKQP